MKKVVLSMVLLGAANLALAATPNSNSISVPAAPAATVTTATESVTTTESPWSQTAYYKSITGAAGAHRGRVAAATSSEAYFQVNRKLSGDRSIGVRGLFLKENGSESLDFFDPYVLVKFSPFMGSTVRTNIPMSGWSREIGRHEVRYDGALELAKSGKMTASWITVPRAYFYTGKKDGQRAFRWENDVQVSYQVASKAEVYGMVGFEANTYNTGRGIGFAAYNSGSGKLSTGRDKFYHLVEVGVEYKPFDGMTLIGSVAQGNEESDKFKLFNDDETAYLFIVSASL